MFGARSEHVRSHLLTNSELAPNMFGASSELGSIMEFGFNKNSSGDEIANVNFLYDDTLHALQNIVRC